MWLDLLMPLFSLPTFSLFVNSLCLSLSLCFNKRISPHRRLLDYKHIFTYVQRDEMTCCIHTQLTNDYLRVFDRDSYLKLKKRNLKHMTVIAALLQCLCTWSLFKYVRYVECSQALMDHVMVTSNSQQLVFA